MVDFTAGVVMDRVKQNTDDPAVSFTLKHELARVNFVVKLDRTGFDATLANKTKVNVKSIKINKGDGFKQSANYTFATTAGTNGTWDYENAVATLVDLDVTPIMNTAAPSEMGGYTTEGVLVADGTEVALFQTNEYLFLIPNKDDDSGKVTVTIDYDIVTVDGALSSGHVSSSATKVVTIPSNNFEQGKAKKYVFTIGLHKVKVEASVEAWDTETDGGNTTVDGGSSEPTTV